jgi:type III secretory pathway lipoprotein EscJ
VASARSLGVLASLGLALGACEAGSARVEQPRVEQPRVDKRAMFASASLVPTREGERARRELAIAGELERALVELGLGPAHVDVELREPAAVIVIAQRPADRSAAEAETAAAKLAHALVPELDAARLHVWLRPADDGAETKAGDGRRSSAHEAALLLACLGLGLSLGALGERLRSRAVIG